MAAIQDTAEMKDYEIKSASTTYSRAPEDDDEGLSSGAVAGIVIGCIVGLALLVGGGAFFLQQHSKPKTDFQDAVQMHNVMEGEQQQLSP